MLETTASERFEDPTRRRGAEFDSDTASLIVEARRVTDLEDDEDIIRRALSEFIERQRFLTWVADHEKSDKLS